MAKPALLGNRTHSATLNGPAFTAEDVTNVAQIASFVAKVCSDAGHATEGLQVADVLGDLAKRITQSLPVMEQLRLAPPPLALQQEPRDD